MASAQPITDTDAAVVTETELQIELAENFQAEPVALPEAITAAPAAAESAEAGDPVVDEKDKELQEMKAKWPGWPGYSVFRIVVPVLKVGGIIGRKGDLIKKLIEETRARVRVLDGPVTSPDRIVIKFSTFLTIYLAPFCLMYNSRCMGICTNMIQLLFFVIVFNFAN